MIKNKIIKNIIRNLVNEEIGRNYKTPYENTLPMDPSSYPELNTSIESLPKTNKWTVEIKSTNSDYPHHEIKEFNSEPDAIWYAKNRSDKIRNEIMNSINFPTNNTKKHK